MQTTPTLLRQDPRTLCPSRDFERVLCAASKPLSMIAGATLGLCTLFGQAYFSDEVMAQSGANSETGSQTANETVSGPDHQHVTIVIGGDLGLGGSLQRVHPNGARRHGQLMAWSDMTGSIAALINGDVNFANLETVVTDSNTLPPWRKLFNFRSHPHGVRHLVDVGFNVFSTANNHSIDYGARGMRETMKNLSTLQSHGLLAAPGLGLARDTAGKPSLVEVKSAKILVSAVGIGGISPSKSGPGILSYRSNRDFGDAVSWLSEREGDYRILSIHYGSELSIRPSARDIQKLRDQAVTKGGIDLVVGHHAHVAAGIQQVDGKLIFYGLGNLLHPGMQNMSAFGSCRDYGVLAKLHLTRQDGEKLRARAIEVWPLQDMHAAAKVMGPSKSRRRIAILNGLAERLDDVKSGARGVRFVARSDGSGLACLSGSKDLGGAIGALCGDWIAPPAKQPRSARVSCAGSTRVIAQRRKHYRKANGKGSVKTSKNRAKQKKPREILTNILAY